jgi:hypothetical protein
MFGERTMIKQLIIIVDCAKTRVVNGGKKIIGILPGKSF